MHTPEPRCPRSSDGVAASVTPLVDSTNVTPTPRAGYLRRGDASALHGAIAAGPSVLFDDEAGTAVAVDVSPQPSQLTQQQQQLPPGQARLPRQRPRFHTVQDLDVALNQAIEGKINSRNAWASKEASDLLEGITHTIETTLDAASADDYSGFAKAATVVEGCSKVWTSRVDSTYQQSNQMVQRLLRKDDTSGKAAGGEREGEEEGDDATQQSQRSKSRARSAAAAAATRTLALDATEINLDSKSRTALTQTGVNAQFRAITSKFDQGNAQGLLMNNAPFGRAGNIILDVDYSLLPASVMAAGRVSGGRGSGRRRSHDAAAAEPAAPASLRGEHHADVAADADVSAVTSRTSQHAAVEHDAAVYESVEFPPYAGATGAAGQGPVSSPSGSPNAPSSARASFAPAQHGSVMDNSGSNTRGSQASQLDPLLLLPHASPSSLHSANREDGRRLSALKIDAKGTAGGRLPGDSAGGVGNGEGDEDGNDGGYADNGDWDAGGEDTYEDDTPYTAGGAGMGAADASDGRDSTTNTGGGVAVVRDLGLEARNLVSGVTEMEAMYTFFHGHTQLALEAEDPTSWCPLSEVASNPLAGGLGRSELSRLHREHRFTQSQKQQAGLAGAAAGGGAPAAESSLKPGSPTNLIAKRGRKERTVIFQLPDSACAKSSDAAGAATFSAKAELREDGALRQATTAARNITPLGKQLLLGKDAAHNVVAYTQSAVQRAKAEQAGLLLAEAPIPGKTIPSYMPYPIHTQDYFQPFSIALTQWNLLRKSATGRLIDNNMNSSNGANDATGSAPSNSASLGSGVGGHRLGYYGSEAVAAGAADADDDGDYGGYREADMPVEFFPGGAEVEGVDGAEAGGDYADYADLYEPDGDNASGDDAEERRYVQEGFRSSSDARLLAQVELAATTRNSADSSSFSDRSSGGNNAEGLLSDPMELLRVLSSPEATMPNQVDVVRLRQFMWEALQGHLTANHQDKAVDLAALRREAAGATSADAGEDGQGARKAKPATTKTAVKAHAQAALCRLRKRSRAAVEEEEEESGSEEEEEAVGETQLSPHKSGCAAALLSDVPATTKFSDVVRSVLPHITAVSSTNTLSPAFFFFSILFLVNEHNVVLQNVETLDDLRACGIARCVGE